MPILFFEITDIFQKITIAFGNFFCIWIDKLYCTNTHSGFIRSNEMVSYERMNRLHTEQ